MTLTGRDRKMVIVAIPVLLVVVYWFMLLSPKRQAASAAGETLATEQQTLADAEARAGTLTAAQDNFARDYAAVVRLGKAVPTSVDMPSLLVQLEQAAKGTGIEFESVSAGDPTTLDKSTSPAASAAAATTAGAPDPAAPAPGTPGAAPASGMAPSGQPPQSGPGQAAATAQTATNTASAPPPGADPTGAAAPTGAPATGALEAVPLDFSFKGSFFELASLFHRLKRFVYVSGDSVRVRGRLMTIDSVTYATDPTTFPTLTAEVTATVFLTPAAEGIAAGATPAGPAPAPAPSAPAPSTSTASTGTSAPPAPTATATP